MRPADVSSIALDLGCTSTADLHPSYTKETMNKDFVYLSEISVVQKMQFDKEHIFK